MAYMINHLRHSHQHIHKHKPADMLLLQQKRPQTQIQPRWTLQVRPSFVCVAAWVTLTGWDGAMYQQIDANSWRGQLPLCHQRQHILHPLQFACPSKPDGALPQQRLSVAMQTMLYAGAEEKTNVAMPSCSTRCVAVDLVHSSVRVGVAAWRCRSDWMLGPQQHMFPHTVVLTCTAASTYLCQL
jgi:hypothetical protein